MSTRAVVKYGALGAITSAYALATVRLLRPDVLPEPAKREVLPQQILIGSGAMLALTWLAGLL